MKGFLKFMAWTTLILCIFAISTGAVLWYIWSSNLPYIGTLREYNPPIITEIFSDDGEVIGRFWDEKRIVITLDQVPEYLIQAFVAAEDARFFEHEGIDIRSIIRAFMKNLKAGKIEQGGSTITQQVTRSLLLKNLKKTYKRKAREALLSIQIEKTFSKEEILFLYINQIYLGHGAYGVEAAARTYFNKSAAELNIAESAMLAGLPQAPSRYSPIENFHRVRIRQKYVLERMREEGFITPEQEQDALKTDIVITNADENPFQKSPYFTEHIRRYLENKYGRELLYRGGLKVYTTMNLEMQHSAQKALHKGLREFDKREGYRGPLRNITPEEIEAFKEEQRKEHMAQPPEIDAIVEGIVQKVDDKKREVIVAIGDKLGLLPLSEMKWARTPDPEVVYTSPRASIKTPGEALKEGDVILCRIKDRNDRFDWLISLEQEPEIQGALLSMEAKTGRIRAMVGGRDFSVSQFNRVIQARRQPGSAFKPIIYSAALDQGMTPSSVIIDAPITIMNPDDEEIWRPKNYKERFFGPTLFRTGLIKSRNVITIKILEKIGVHNTIQYARKMGIESDLNPDLSLALGSSGLSLLELTTAYSVFDNGGMLVKPIFIYSIEDRTGQIIEENHPSIQESIPKETAYIMTDLLQAAIKEEGGTGHRARALRRPAAGKTGTTNDLRDAWFLGFTPGLVTGVWVGYDDRKPMGEDETGSRAACPIWLYFMEDALKDTPVKDFIAPQGVVFSKIDTEKGLLASPYSKKTVFQAFKQGTEPKKYSPQPKAAKSDRFTQFDMGDSEEKHITGSRP